MPNKTNEYQTLTLHKMSQISRTVCMSFKRLHGIWLHATTVHIRYVTNRCLAAEVHTWRSTFTVRQRVHVHISLHTDNKYRGAVNTSSRPLFHVCIHRSTADKGYLGVRGWDVLLVPRLTLIKRVHKWEPRGWSVGQINSSSLFHRSHSESEKKWTDDIKMSPTV